MKHKILNKLSPTKSKSKLTKSKLTKAVVYVIVSIIALTPIQIKASTGGANGGDASTIIDAAASSTTATWADGSCGYRFYIVDSNFHCVSKVNDYVSEMPGNVSSDTLLKAPRGESWDSVPEQGYYLKEDGGELNTYTKLQEKCNTTSKVPEFGLSDSSSSNNGEEFRKWFLKNIEGSVISHSTSATHTTTVTATDANTPTKTISSDKTSNLPQPQTSANIEFVISVLIDAYNMQNAPNVDLDSVTPVQYSKASGVYNTMNYSVYPLCYESLTEGEYIRNAEITLATKRLYAEGCMWQYADTFDSTTRDLAVYMCFYGKKEVI